MLVCPILLYVGTDYLRQGANFWRVAYEVTSSELVVRHGARVAWTEVEHLKVYWPRRGVFHVAEVRCKDGSLISLVPDPTGGHPEWIAAVVRAADAYPHIAFDVPEALPTWYPEVKNVRLRKDL